MLTGKHVTIEGNIKYNIYEFIGFEKWDQKNGEAHQSFMVEKEMFIVYPHEITWGNWNFAKK